MPSKYRHQGAFNPDHEYPFELSRGAIDLSITCPGCFWLEKAAGVKKQDSIPFTLNSNTDVLLKRDHDQYRGKRPSPIMVSAGLEQLRPFAHPELELWTDSMNFGKTDGHFNTLHEETNIKFGGGLSLIHISEPTRPY